ncbi:hypothetical protein LG293_15865 (plasmid) [Citricoccus nitrophenolicus]
MPQVSDDQLKYLTLDPMTEAPARQLLDLLQLDAVTDDRLIAVRAAHAYQRKAELNFDALGTDRNSRYGSASDPIIVEVRFELDRHDDAYPIAQRMGDEMRKETLDSQLAELDRQAAALDAQREAIRAARSAL